MAEVTHHRTGDVEPGLTLADIKTTEACDAVLDRLQAGIVGIEQRLATARVLGSASEPADWRARANAALRAKKFWLPRVQARRSEIGRQARQEAVATAQAEARSSVEKKRKLLVGLAWDTEPDAMKRVEALARERHPELFDGGEAA